MKRVLAIATSLLCVAELASAQGTRVNETRADGRTTPLLVYAAQHTVGGCAPLAVISHGAGGSENGYVYLAQSMADLGFTTVVMGHQESGGSALRSDMRANGIRRGVAALVADRSAEEARLLDIGAALKWSEGQCHAPLRILLGHSMGSETVMLEAGARNVIGISAPVSGQDRFDAYVALSPEGPGLVFPEQAWSDLHKPMLDLTGTRDQSLTGAPLTRQIPYLELPATDNGSHWMGVIEGATHMNFAGTGPGHLAVEADVTRTIGAFVAGVRSGVYGIPASNSRVTFAAK